MLKNVLSYSFKSAVLTLAINWLILKVVILEPGISNAGLGAVAFVFGLGIILLIISAILVCIFSWRKFHSIKASFIILLLSNAWLFAIFSIINGKFQEGIAYLFKIN